MRLAKGPASTRGEVQDLDAAEQIGHVRSTPWGCGPAGHAVVELHAGAVEEAAHDPVAAGGGDEMDDVGVSKCSVAAGPRRVADAVVGVEVVDELQDGRGRPPTTGLRRRDAS